MRDPHIVSLTYIVRPSDTASYDCPDPLKGTIEDLEFHLVHEKLRIEPTIHFPTVQGARNYIDPLLESWEIDIGLQYGNPELSFKYESAEVIDRNPPPPPPPGSPQTHLISGTAVAVFSGSTSIQVTRTKYPEPPLIFRSNPDVYTLWKRYQGYKSGREPLPAMAYFCLTVLEAKAGNRKQAAATFKISLLVLKKMGQLTSTRGDEATARKYHAITFDRPLTEHEIHWIEEVVKAIIRRVGEFQSIKTLSEIGLENFPPL